MKRGYLAVMGVAAGVAIGLVITFFGSLNTHETMINVVPAEEGTIVSNTIHPKEKVSKTFDVNNLGKMFIEFDIKSDEGANVNYWMESPSGTTLLAAPKVSSSTVLKIHDQNYTLVPIIGSPAYNDISGNLVFLNYGRMGDVSTDLNGSIALVERGGPVDDAQISFLEKQTNTARKGASALIVFNDRAGPFYGDLRSPFPDKQATIPAFSMSREDGLKLKNQLAEEILAGTITDIDKQPKEFWLPYGGFEINLNEKGTYQIWFQNEGPGNAEATVKYIFRES